MDLAEAIRCAELLERSLHQATRPLIDRAGSTLTIAIKGSSGWREWFANAELQMAPFRIPGTRVHGGFREVFDRIAEPIAAEIAAREPVRLVLAGHSLGGAVASMLAAWLARPGLDVSVYTYGSPAPGDRAFAAAHEERAPAAWRIVHDLDAAPHTPKGPYHHVGSKLWIDGDGRDIGPLRGGWRTARFYLQRLSWDDRGDHRVDAYLAALRARAARSAGGTP